MKSEMLYDASKYVFIKGVIDDSIVIHKKTNDEIESQLDSIDKIIKKDDSYEYLMSMPIKSMTDERVNKLKENIMKSKEEYKELMSETIQNIWYDEILSL
jgi:DNA topoisomerase-2